MQPFDGTEFADHTISFLCRREEHKYGQPRLSIDVVERDRHVKRDRAVIGTVRVDEAFRFFDFDEDDPVGVVGAVGAVHGEAPDAAGTDIHFVDRIGEAPRSPPVHDVFRIGPGSPDQFTWRVEYSCRCNRSVVVSLTLHRMFFVFESERSWYRF